MANCVKCGRRLPSLLFGKKVCEWCVRHEAAQRGEEPEDATQPVMPAPWVSRTAGSITLTQVFFGINVAVFIGMALAGVSITGPTGQQLVQWGANWGPLTLGGEWWRLLTCVFLHIGLIHIGFNMWCLWDLGALCESLYGSWTFGAVYLISGVAASAASVTLHPVGVSAGASGAIFGIAGALIASFYLGEFSMPRAAVMGTLRSVVMFAGYNLLFGAMTNRTDNAAHIGGLVTGLVFGALIARVAPDSSHAIRRATVLMVVLLAVGSGVALLYHSRSYIIHVQRAGSLLAQNKTDQAIAELQTAIRQRPDYMPAHFQLARAYSIKGDSANAETELKRVIELDPQEETAHYLLGLLYLDENRTQQAKDAFAYILTRDPESADAHFGIAMAAAAEGNHQLAIQEYNTAAKLDPELNGLYYNLGRSYAKLQMYDEAIAAYLKEQEQHGDDYDTQLALAGAYQAKGMQQKAEEATRKATQLKAGQ